MEEKSKNNLLDNDFFCYTAAEHSILYYGLKVNGYTEMEDIIGSLTTLPREIGLELALRICNKIPLYTHGEYDRYGLYLGDELVTAIYDQLIKTDKSNRKYFLRYFKFLKDKMGKYWVQHVITGINNSLYLPKKSRKYPPKRYKE